MFDQENRLPENIKAALKKFRGLCDKIQTSVPDSGFKGGIKTTSYQYKVNDNVSLNIWYGDAEISQSMVIDGELAVRFYDCWGTGFFEFLAETTVDELLMIMENQEQPNAKLSRVAVAKSA